MFVKVKQCSCVGAIGRYCNEGSPASPSFAPFLLIPPWPPPVSQAHTNLRYMPFLSYYLIILLSCLFIFITYPPPLPPPVSQAHTNPGYMPFLSYYLIILLSCLFIFISYPPPWPPLVSQAHTNLR